jgi:hypothetical protein
MSRHPNRRELLDAARSNGHDFDDHLRTCEQCKELFELFRAYQVAGNLPLAEAPEAWILKAVDLARQSRALAGIKNLLARLSFDSWAMPVSVGVRGGEAQQERRLRFEVDDLLLDLRAEKRKQGWDFIAQLTGSRVTEGEFRLLVSNQELRVNDEGFYQWSSKRPPRQIRLRSDNYVVAIPDISWKAAHKQ